ncbi:MAG: TIR domain-containing protein [Melioribacteraceae bacterium]
MSQLFISHSSNDKQFAKQLASDLMSYGHSVWFDEWNIKVGECIVSEIEKGIQTSDYMIIILSSHSVNSSWVEKEWKTKYWDEINNKKVLVLPTLIEKCDIPPLLKTKKYADFTKSYAVGFANLVNSLTQYGNIEYFPSDNNDAAIKLNIQQILRKSQSNNERLSVCIAESMTIASKLNDKILERFCSVELKGITAGEKYPDFNHRKIPVFASAYKLNNDWFGWDGDITRAIQFMENDPENYKKIDYLLWQPIFELEEISQQDNLDKKIFSFSLTAKQIDRNLSNPDLRLYLYAKLSSIKDVLIKTRTRLTELLLNHINSNA